MVENSSMQQMPPSASTRAPASNTKSGPSRTAAQVRPALVQPRPLVRTLLALSSCAACRSCDFPVPGSPSSSRWGVVRRCDWSFVALPLSAPAAVLPATEPLPRAAQPVAFAAAGPSGSEGRKRFQRFSRPAPPPSTASPAAPAAIGEPPMSVRRRASLGMGMPLSHGAVARISSCRTRHWLPWFRAQSFTNSSLPVLGPFWMAWTGDSVEMRSTCVASMKSSTSSLLPCQSGFQRWCTTPSRATVSPGWMRPIRSPKSTTAMDCGTTPGPRAFIWSCRRISWKSFMQASLAGRGSKFLELHLLNLAFLALEFQLLVFAPLWHCLGTSNS
mmetsp:Transcript_91341/g.289562  ORF Transcript_91341/g.289562 Transcript_91341/m.289562 type:complete len:330 (-) Transcript_91341:706-1695(-)